MADQPDRGRSVQLWPVQEADLSPLLQLLWDPQAPGEYQWFVFRLPRVKELERRW